MTTREQDDGHNQINLGHAEGSAFTTEQLTTDIAITNNSVEIIQTETTTTVITSPADGVETARPENSGEADGTIETDPTLDVEYLTKPLRALVDEQETPPPNELYQMRVRELTEELMRTPAAIAISRLAYMGQVNDIITHSNAMQNALLYLAEDLSIQLPMTRISPRLDAVSSIKVPLTIKSALRREEFLHAAVLIRSAVDELRRANAENLMIIGKISEENAKLRDQLEVRAGQLTEALKSKPPAFIDGCIIYYRDRKGRHNYLSVIDVSTDEPVTDFKALDNQTYRRTRNFSEATVFATADLAAINLSHMLRRSPLARAIYYEIVNLYFMPAKPTEELYADVARAKSEAIDANVKPRPEKIDDAENAERAERKRRRKRKARRQQREENRDGD